MQDKIKTKKIVLNSPFKRNTLIYMKKESRRLRQVLIAVSRSIKYNMIPNNLANRIPSNCFWFFILQTEARVREVGQREDRDAEALRYGKALCKFLFVSFLSTRSNLVISFFSRESRAV